MKKILLLIVAITVFGCSDDDNNSTTDYSGYVNPRLKGEWVATNIIGQSELPPCLSKNGYKFGSAGACTIIIDNMNTPCSSTAYPGTYTVTGDILTIDSPGGIPLEYKIVSLTGTKLQLKVLNLGLQVPVTEYTKK